MITLSSHQRAALECLRDGSTLNTTNIAERVGTTFHVTSSIMSLLRARGLVSLRGSGFGGPRRFLWTITTVGRGVLAEPAHG